jgi:uncharacterized iron-regulated protein
MWDAWSLTRGESFEKEDQGLIDAYLQAKTPQAEAKALAALADALQTKWGWSRADYLDVVRAAKSNGLVVDDNYRGRRSR